jgi:DNA-binding GntR family transcriptional regulator
MARDVRRTRKTAARPAQPEPAPVPDETSERPSGKGSRGMVAYQLLRDAIASGRLKPGARVLESELAALLDMSRTPIREAIAALEADGLVSVDGARGRVVTQLDYQSIMELYQVFEVLEPPAAGLAARHASDMEVGALREMLEVEEGILDDAARLADHDRRFHEAVFHCSHNRYMVKLLQHLRTAKLLLQPATRVGEERRETALPEHRAVVDAIAARDAAAAESAMREHIRRAQQSRIKQLLKSR